jgi:hypothetical protein
MTTILDVPSSYPANPFTAPIQALLTSTDLPSAPGPSTGPSSGPGSTVDETAASLVATVATSSDPAHALWELWDAFFTAVATSAITHSHTPHIALLDAIRAQPPTRPNNVLAGSDAERQLRSYTQADGKLYWPALPRFGAQWRDVHDILEAWRDWDGVRASGVGGGSAASTPTTSGDKYYLRFCIFSAALLEATKVTGEAHPVWVFYACRNVLEREGPEPRQPKAHRMSPEQVWTLDVRVAATWMRGGGQALWRVGPEELRRHWAAALDEKTELWPRNGGLTRERWELWGKRLRALSTEDGNLDDETRAVVIEAAEVVERILKESST